MVIWKYALSVTDIQTIMMPAGAKVLAVQTQFREPKLWVLCDSDERIKQESRVFAIYGTGHEINEGPGEYIGTFQIYEGNGVFHVFEVTPH